MQHNIAADVNGGIPQLNDLILSDIQTAGRDIHRRIRKTHTAQVNSPSRGHRGVVKYPAPVRVICMGIIMRPSLICRCTVIKNRRAPHINGRHVLDALVQHGVAITAGYYAAIQ